MKQPEKNPEASDRVFLFRLAKDLHMTVNELEKSITTNEFTEWAAYYTVLAREEEAAHKRAEQKSRASRGRR